MKIVIEKAIEYHYVFEKKRKSQKTQIRIFKLKKNSKIKCQYNQAWTGMSSEVSS